MSGDRSIVYKGTLNDKIVLSVSLLTLHRRAIQGHDKGGMFVGGGCRERCEADC